MKRQDERLWRAQSSPYRRYEVSFPGLRGADKGHGMAKQNSKLQKGKTRKLTASGSEVRLSHEKRRRPRLLLGQRHSSISVCWLWHDRHGTCKRPRMAAKRLVVAGTPFESWTRKFQYPTIHGGHGKRELGRSWNVNSVTRENEFLTPYNLCRRPGAVGRVEDICARFPFMKPLPINIWIPLQGKSNSKSECSLRSVSLMPTVRSY